MGRHDQAQLASCALDFAKICDGEDRKTCLDLATDIMEYSIRDLLGKEGAFFSAEDADSAPSPGAKKSGAFRQSTSPQRLIGLEGAFYIWDKEELDSALGEDAEVFGYFFGVEQGGNVNAEHDMHGEMTGKVRSPIAS